MLRPAAVLAGPAHGDHRRRPGGGRQPRAPSWAGPAGSPRPRASPWPPRPAPSWRCPAPIPTERWGAPWRSSRRCSGGRGLLRVDLREPAHLAVIRDASEAGRQLELHYYSASSDRESTRVVDPVSVRLIEGHWYLDGYCHNAPGMRRFRVDRVSAARLTGEPAGHRGEAPSPDRRRRPPRAPRRSCPGPRPPSHTWRSTTTAVWIIEALLNSSPEPLPDGRTGVTLAVASTVWFGRCCCAWAPTPRSSTRPSWPTTGRQAARQLLARYRGERRILSAAAPPAERGLGEVAGQGGPVDGASGAHLRRRVGVPRPGGRVLRVAKVRKGGARLLPRGGGQRVGHRDRGRRPVVGHGGGRAGTRR